MKLIYLHNPKHKFWENYKLFPPIRYTWFKFFASYEHSFNRIYNSKKKKIIEFEQILLLTGSSFDYTKMLKKKNWLKKRLEKCDIKILITPTIYAKQHALRYLGNSEIIRKKIKVVPPSINLKKTIIKKIIKPIKKINLLFIGQSFYGKGGPICFKIADLLNEKKINFRFKFVCSDVPNNFTIPENVEVINYKITEREKYKLYKWCHLFIFPVIQDSFGVFMECIETSTPIICTNIFDKTEIIKNKENGIIINTPFQLYQFKNFGKKYKNWDQFKLKFIESFNKGLFDKLIAKYAKTIIDLYKNHSKINDLSKNIYRKSWVKYHPNKRNLILKSIYKNLLN